MNLVTENKIAGILTPLFALRSEKGLGIGDVATLRESSSNFTRHNTVTRHSIIISNSNLNRPKRKKVDGNAAQQTATANHRTIGSEKIATRTHTISGRRKSHRRYDHNFPHAKHY